MTRILCWFIIIGAFAVPEFALSQASGPLRVSGINPRYLVSQADTAKAIWLGGFHLWSNVQDGANIYPPPVVNMRKYWDSLSANRNNFVRLWSGWEQAAGLIETADNWYWEPMPFRRTGPGNGRDGRLKFNLDSLNQPFFNKVRQYCDSLGLRGIYVAVQLFDGWSNAYPNHGYSAGNPWYYHPYNAANNANGVNGDPNGNGSGEEVHYSPYSGGRGVQAVWDRQWKYIKKFVDELNGLDNIFWEICNEAEGFGETVAWQNLIADSIHAYEARKPKRHVVWFTAGDYQNSSLWYGHGECVAPGAFGLDGNIWMTSPPDSNGRKVVIVDTDHIWGMVYDNQVPWVWKNFCNGNSVTLQDNFCSEPAYPYWDCDNVNWPPFRRAMGVAIGLANTADLLHMTPQPNKSNTSNHVLFGSATGEVIVFQETGSIEVDLTQIPDSVNVRWYDPDDFLASPGTKTAGGASRTFTSPNTRYDVLYLYTAASAPTSPVLLSPPNGSTQQPVVLECRWHSSAATSTYHYQLALSPSFSSTLVDDSLLADTTRQVSGLAAATTYHWRVKASNSQGSSSWSPVWSFTTLVQLPGVPTLLDPANLATGQPLSPTLRWNSTPGAFSYDVQLSVDSSFSSIIFRDSLQVDTTTQVVGLGNATTYYWRVRSRNGAGLSNWTGAWQFTTIVPVPNATVLVAPLDGVQIKGDSVLFSWRTGQPSVSSYWFELAPDSLFMSTSVDSTITDTTILRTNLTAHPRYWWRVRGRNVAGWGLFSQHRSFRPIITGADQLTRIAYRFRLEPSFPNPFNAGTVILVEIPSQLRVTLKVYNILGQEVKTLLDDVVEPGRHSIRWDGTDNMNRALGSGCYLYRVVAGEFREEGKMLILK